ncbi:MAG: hypothetical protein NVSMB66_6110 [Candidatus Doudnabacteria bacterium]
MTIDYEALAKKYGGTTSPSTPQSNGKVDYASIAKQFGGTTKPAPHVYNPIDITQEQEQPGFKERIGNYADNRLTKMGESLNRQQYNGQGVMMTALDSMGSMAGLMGDIGGDIVKSATPQFVKDYVKNSLHNFSQTTPGQLSGKAANTTAQAAGDFSQKHPALAAHVGAVGEIFSLYGGARGVGSLAGMAERGIPKIIDKAVSLGEEGITKTKSLYTPKKLGEVLATPESEVHKLNSVERKVWFDNQQSQVADRSTSVNSQLQQKYQDVTSKLTKQSEDLQKQLAVSSRDKVIELRPKIIKAMGEQSKVYRQLIEDELKGKENLPVGKDDIKAFIDSRYGEDPGRAAAIKERLGLTEKVNPTSPKAAPKNWKLSQTQTTLGKMYEQTKSLKGEIKAGAGRVFTTDEKLTDESIHTLSSYMKQQGVDFSKANQFWAKYAPVRDQLIREAKPFVQAGTQTKNFANTLTRVAQGTDINNENFINEVEHLVGEPVTTEQKSIVAKLNKNEKLALSSKVNMEEAKLNIKMQEDKTLKMLSDKHFEIERQARQRELLKNVLTKWLPAAVAGDITLKKVTGIGF